MREASEFFDTVETTYEPYMDWYYRWTYRARDPEAESEELAAGELFRLLIRFHIAPDLLEKIEEVDKEFGVDLAGVLSANEQEQVARSLSQLAGNSVIDFGGLLGEYLNWWLVQSFMKEELLYVDEPKVHTSTSKGIDFIELYERNDELRLRIWEAKHTTDDSVSGASQRILQFFEERLPVLIGAEISRLYRLRPGDLRIKEFNKLYHANDPSVQLGGFIVCDKAVRLDEVLTTFHTRLPGHPERRHTWLLPLTDFKTIIERIRKELCTIAGLENS